jgi:hypothetical protein
MHIYILYYVYNVYKYYYIIYIYILCRFIYVYILCVWCVYIMCMMWIYIIYIDYVDMVARRKKDLESGRTPTKEIDQQLGNQSRNFTWNPWQLPYPKTKNRVLVSMFASGFTFRSSPGSVAAWYQQKHLSEGPFIIPLIPWRKNSKTDNPIVLVQEQTLLSNTNPLVPSVPTGMHIPIKIGQLFRDPE